MKKIVISVLSLLLVMGMCLSLCACATEPKNITQRELTNIINEKLSYAVNVQNMFLGNGTVIKLDAKLKNYNYAALGEEDFYPVHVTMIYDHYDELMAGAREYFTEDVVKSLEAYLTDSKGNKKFVDLGYSPDIRMHMNMQFKGTYYIAQAKYSSIKIIDRDDDVVTVRIFGEVTNCDIRMTYIDGDWYFGDIIGLKKP